MDPLELRLKNSNQAGVETACGAEVCGCAMTECIVAAADGIEWDREERQERTTGCAAWA